MFFLLKYKSLCDRTTHHVNCVLSALSRRCLACHFSHWRAWYNCLCEPHTNNPVPGNKSVPAKVLARNTRTFAVTDLFPDTGLLAYGSQKQLYHALQWGNVKQDSACWVQTADETAHKSWDDCFNRTTFCNWVKGTQIWALETVSAKVTIILPPLYGPTVLRPNSQKDFRDHPE